MIEWKNKEYKNIFDMPFDVFNDYCNNSEQFQDFCDIFAKEVERNYETNPYFNAEECCIYRCPFNSGYDHSVEMGERTICKKFKWQEKNTCENIEHYFS